MNTLERFSSVFDVITPYAGTPPKGFQVDFLGVLTDSRFRQAFGGDPERDGGSEVQTKFPILSEGWFEAVDWIESAKAARDRYTMISLGAFYGSQAVCAAKTLEAINPMPFKLATVEPEPTHNEWIRKHFRDNRIDPDDHWIVEAAVSDSYNPVFFPIGAPEIGGHNAISTNHPKVREWYVDEIIKNGRAEQALRSLLTSNSTGLIKDLRSGGGYNAEIKLVSAVTLGHVLAPFDRVDLLEVDIQQSEMIVFESAMQSMHRKVRRAHIGTHGIEVHNQLLEFFKRHSWEIIFSYEPDRVHETSIGCFKTSDGILTVVNTSY